MLPDPPTLRTETLPQPEFVTALKRALRDFSRPDLLVRNPMLRANLLARYHNAGPAELRALLAETASTMFASPRDQKLRRAIELTYFQPAAKQEVVADRLGLSFGTYRRHLTAAQKRFADWLWQKEQEASRAGPAEAPRAGPASVAEEVTASLARRLSIVILPFLNLSEDGSAEYLVDGIVDNLITDLSRALPGSFVVPRSTARTYKGRAITIRQVGQELGVRYVLEGSVLVDANCVRVNAQLVDAETDEPLWAECFDKERKDILAVQVEIVARLSRSVGLQMIRSEATRSASPPDVTDLVMRARMLANDLKLKESASGAVELFRQALELDPDNIDALTGLATVLTYQVLNQYLSEREPLLDEAEAIVSRAMRLAPDHIGALKSRTALLRARGRFTESAVAAATVIAHNPGEPTAYREMGLNKLYLGETETAAEWFRRADRIAPRDPARWTWLQGLGRAMMQLGHDAEAVDALQKTLDSNPAFSTGRAMLAAAEALAGNIEVAGSHMAEFAAADPGMTIERFATERSPVPLETVHPTYLRENERILEGLRLAGMPGGAAPTRAAASSAAGPPRLSIVVLPFVDLGEVKDGYFVDGITESLTTDISRIPGSFVIAHSTALSYKEKTIDLRQLGHELGVRYVMEGSVQGAEDRVRFNAQLIDAETGAHIWAERFDKPRAGLFEMEDEVTARLARMVGVELIAAESRRAARKQPGYWDSMDFIMRGWAVLNEGPSIERARTARQFFEKALRLDGQNVGALLGLAKAHMSEVNMYVSEDRAGQMRVAEAAVLQALGLEPGNAHVRCTRGTVLYAMGMPDRALREFELALAIDRNLAMAHAYSGLMKFFLGRAHETEGHVDEAMRLSPRDPLLFHWHYLIGVADFYLGRVVRAICGLRKSVEISSNWALSQFVLAAVLAQAGLLAEAVETCDAARRLAPNFTVNKFRAQIVSTNPIYLAQRERLYEGLLRAGVPES